MKNVLKIVLYIPFILCFIVLEAMDDGKEFIHWSVASRQGRRETMEDACVVVRSPRSAFCAVYDGHGGHEAARYAAENMHKLFAEYLERYTINDAFEKSFKCVDAEIQKRYENGTAALAAYIKDNKAHIAWAGDSRAVILTGDGVLAFSTQDHKPDMPEELRRIKACGGTVKHHFGIARVIDKSGRCPNLSLSRTLGDRSCKYILPGEIIGTPDIQELELPNDGLVILGCDGVWDQLSSEDVAFITQHTLKKLPPEELAEYFIKSGKISPYYGRALAREFEYCQKIVWRDEADGEDLYNYYRLGAAIDPEELSHQSPEELSRKFLTTLYSEHEEEIAESGGNDITLELLAQRIRDISYALSAEFNGDNISVVVAQKKDD